MANDVVVVADRLFNGKAWTISRHKRQNGTGFWQLTELAGYRTDFPIIYDDGRVSFDRPENIPLAVRKWTESTLRRVTKNFR